ncbi:hypothetical protein [Staphylococcus simulans]|uniref:hypothetical protein n=1 Tax=Staphylococcus simulans TaxID=1286 RepID=UPI000E69EC56|nr:hypothetical protein [Staphylococcus simulans]RIN54299.1 hypothetical protein BU029_07615 [Staphylococcus simulans]
MKERNYQSTNQEYLSHILPKFNTSLSTKALQSNSISYQTLMNHFDHLLNASEKALLESVLNSTLTIITLSRTDYYQLTLLKATHYIIAIAKDRYYLSPEFLNDYNHCCLNEKYSSLPLLEDWVHTKIETLASIEEKRRSYETMDFETCLADRYSTKNLDFICVMANIKNYDKLTDSEKCTLITKKVMKDYGLFEKLIQIVPPLRILFAYMVYEDRNSFVGAELPGENIAVFILFSDIELSMIYLPCDLFEHLKCYFSLRGLQPEEILKQSIEDFTDQALDEDLQQALLKDLCHNRLSVGEAKKVLPALMHNKIQANILTDLNTETKIKFFEALVNLYGFIPIKIVVKLYNSYFEAHETSASIKDKISTDYKSHMVAISDNYLTHTTLKEAYQTLNALYETVPYYLPSTLMTLFKAATSEDWIENKNFEDSLLFLRSSINLQGESFDIPIYMVEIAIFEDVILPNIKMVPKEDDLKDAVQMWKAQGLYNNVKTKHVLKHVKIVYSKVRLWAYRGHNQREYNEIIHQYHTHQKPSADDWNSDNSI